MAENGNGSAGQSDAQTGAQQQPQVKMQIVTQYVRDLSFENVMAQRSTRGGNVQPDIQVQVSLDARKRDTENQYEIIQKYKIQSRDKETQDSLFVLELEYAGVFHVENVPQEQLHPFLLIECPRMVFPFVRRIVSDVTRDGGFPPLNLDNIDFLQLYRQELARQSEKRNEQGAETTS